MTDHTNGTGLVRLLICAMGGEGGGVLTGWIVAAARAQGLAVQATSVPGVAQRTGGTTYYIEMAPRDPAGRTPVFALTPVPGQVDVVLASELAEAARAARQGFTTPERTAVVASTHRVLLIEEKMAMGDGRLDPRGLQDVVRQRARAVTFLDMEAIANASGVPISPVMLGALAGAAVLPIDRAHLETAIRDSGIAVDRNLTAFERALAQCGRPETAASAAPAPAATGKAALAAADFVIAEPVPIHADAATFPEIARETISRGIERLTDYQDAAYAALYLRRLEPFKTADPHLLKEVARHLALRMSFEDVIRVAQAKARAARMTRIRGEVGAKDGEPVEVQDFFKPGIAEIADVMPVRIGRWLVRRRARSPRLQRAHIGMKVRTTTISGYLRVYLLARLKSWRPRSFRYAQEQRIIEEWLGAIGSAASRGDTATAREITELARLVKGYGETHARGLANYRRIFDALVSRPTTDKTPDPAAAEKIRAAREAALSDPDGATLARTLELAAHPAA